MKNCRSLHSNTCEISLGNAEIILDFGMKISSKIIVIFGCSCSRKIRRYFCGIVFA